MTGTLINAGAILAGGTIGLVFRSSIPKKYITIVFQSIGLFTLFVGVAMSLKTNNYLIKINIGNNRTGLVYSDAESIESILESTKDSTYLDFKGFLGHAGHTYSCKNKTEVLETHQKSKSKLMRLKDIFKARYPDLILSYGDTPSCSLADDFSGIDEIRPGNFVFYDLMQYQIGACTINQIAVAMACPIVAIHKDRNEIVIYGGGILFPERSAP